MSHTLTAVYGDCLQMISAWSHSFRPRYGVVPLALQQVAPLVLPYVGHSWCTLHYEWTMRSTRAWSIDHISNFRPPGVHDNTVKGPSSKSLAGVPFAHGTSGRNPSCRCGCHRLILALFSAFFFCCCCLSSFYFPSVGSPYISNRS